MQERRRSAAFGFPESGKTLERNARVVNQSCPIRMLANNVPTLEPKISRIQQVVVWHIARWRATAAYSDTMQRIRFLGSELAEYESHCRFGYEDTGVVRVLARSDESCSGTSHYFKARQFTKQDTSITRSNSR